MTNAELLGNKLYYLRKKSGFSQEELADKLNVSRQAISKWERGEALPDTDNLISIAKLYGVSLDELINHKPEQKEESFSNENTSQDHFESNDSNTTYYYDSDEEKVNVKVDKNGIFVFAKDDEDEVKINLNAEGFNVSVNEAVEDIEEEDRYYSYNNDPADKKRKILRFLHRLPYPILVVVAYLLWGFLAKDDKGWSVGWTLFITIPVYYSIIDCFRTKKLSTFCYPVFVTAIYCFLGMSWGLWHPYWILFITIPLFYVVADTLDK